jgi:N-acetylneuraminate synthase
VEGIRSIEKMMLSPVDKEKTARDMNALRNTFTKSIVARKDLPAGTVLQSEHLTLKKPGTGIPAARLPEIIGRRLKEPVKADTLIPEDALA